MSYQVDKIVTLKLKDESRAKEILQTVARQIQPILRKRKWNVPVLQEFYPKDKCLLGLNINQGECIKIRCRRASDQNSFYPMHEIMGTTLHELAHNVHGNHGPEFQKLWDQLWDELEDFQRNGVEGTMPIFEGCGMKVNTNKHNPSTYEAKNIAVKAAEKRARYEQLYKGSGQKLGSSSNGNSNDKRHKVELSPAQMAAQAAMFRYYEN